ncbi:MAG: tetratricopeptide repeat protein [Betaproteobacteria bacterium]|nr:tetratricopeptide repeat protein [Betaproteobacteria bacterium]
MDQREDVFSHLHKLLKEKKYSYLISALLDKKMGGLKKQYRIDGNHAWYLLGDAFYNTQNHEAALDAFIRSIRNRKDDVQALFAIGTSYSELKKPRLAERYLRKSLYYYFCPRGYMRPSFKYDIIYNLANSLFDQKRYQDAIALYMEVDNPNISVYKMALKNRKIAEERLKAVEICADKSNEIFSSAETFSRESRHDEVIATLLNAETKRLITQYRIDGNYAWRLIGLAHYRKENLEKAVQAFRKSIRNRAGDVRALFFMGCSYSELGKFVLSERYFRQALYYYFFPYREGNEMTKYDIIYGLANSLLGQKRYEDAIALYVEIDNPKLKIYKMALKNKKIAEDRNKPWKPKVRSYYRDRPWKG